MKSPDYIDTILIADDNEQTSLLLQTLLSEEGYNFVTADTGQKAVKVITSQRIDLVLLDIVMPDVNGFTVASQMKALSRENFIPIIMVTALCGEDDKITGLAYADDYITKPFSGVELIARIKSLLRIRHLHEELAQSKSRFEALYENFPHLYVSIDSEKKITDCNRFFTTAFKVSKQEIVGKSFFDCILQEDHIDLDHFLNELESPGSVRHRVFRLNVSCRKEPTFATLKAVYIGDKGPGALWAVIAMEDITEQLKMQEEQKIARQQLYRSARLASIGTLASGVAHEINNPLTAILGFSSAILDRLSNNENMEHSELEQYLQIINNEALRCRNIVENLSRFARESGDCQVRQVQLSECIKDAIKLVNAKLVKARIDVETTVSESVFIAANANKIEQVFVNILTNCIDFCGENCQVKIYTVPSRDDARFCAVHVEDNGPGIETEILSNVFDPFFTTKEVGCGAGMGLFICYQIIEEHFGSIDILSEQGKGTTVVLELPKR